MSVEQGKTCCGNCTNPCSQESLRASELRAWKLREQLSWKEARDRVNKAIERVRKQPYF
jgi:hypothetical protein